MRTTLLTLWHRNPTRCALLCITGAVALNILSILLNVSSGFLSSFIFISLLGSLYILSLSGVSRRAQWIAGGIVLGIVLPWMGMHRLDYIDAVTQIAMFATLAMGLNIVVGMAGLLDLGFIAFFAVGAYVWAIPGSTQLSAIWTGFSGLPAWAFFIMLPVGACLAGGIGVLLGLPVLRVKGDYLALVTLGFGEVVRVILNNLDRPIDLTGGPRGIPSIFQPFSNVSKQLAAMSGSIEAYRWQALFYYGLVLLIAAVVVFALSRIVRSPIGWAWEAIREDEIAAQAMGIPKVKMKLLAFASGATVAGAMGVVFAAKQTFISPDSFDFNQSISILAMVVLGGAGSLRGAIAGAAVMVLLNIQVLTGFSSLLASLKASGATLGGWSFSHWPSELEPSKYERLLFGMLIWWMMIYRPEGLLPPVRPLYLREKSEEDAQRDVLNAEPHSEVHHAT